MEETLNPTAEIEQISSESELKSEPQAELDPFQQLVDRRMGSFDVRINYADLKYIKNSLNSKIEWKGPNEAYLLVMSILTIDNALEQMDPKKAEAVTVKLPASTVETVQLFLNRITGKGIESAQKVFSIFMQLRQTIETIKKLDQEIEKMKEESAKTEKKANSSK
jgi:hypothetical protein